VGNDLKTFGPWSVFDEASTYEMSFASVGPCVGELEANEALDDVRITTGSSEMTLIARRTLNVLMGDTLAFYVITLRPPHSNSATIMVA
jgi:hypothetical protein